MAYERPTEGSTVTHTEINSLFSTAYAAANAIDPAVDLREYALEPEHLPSPIALVASVETDLAAGTHAYASGTYPYQGLSGASTWGVVGATLGTPEPMSVTWTAVQSTDATQNNFIGCLEVLASVAVTSIALSGGATRGFAVFAVQLRIAAAWTNFTWTQRFVDYECAAHNHVDLSFLFSGSDLAAGDITGARLVVSASPGGGAGAATVTLEEANLIVHGYRAKVMS